MRCSSGCRSIRRSCRGCCDCLAPGGVLAVQMPDNLMEPSHVLMRETAAAMPFAAKLADAARAPLPAVGSYYDLLCRPFGAARHLAHHLQPSAGRRGGDRRMAEVDRPEAVPRSARRGRARAVPRGAIRRASPRPIPRRATARCCCGFRGCSSWRPARQAIRRDVSRATVRPNISLRSPAGRPRSFLTGPAGRAVNGSARQAAGAGSCNGEGQHS